MKRFTGIDTESLKYLIWEETIFKQKARTPPTSLNKTTDELWAQPLPVTKLHLFSTEKKHIMKYTHLYKIKRSLRKQANVLTKGKKKKVLRMTTNQHKFRDQELVLIAATQRKNRELQVSWKSELCMFNCHLLTNN